MTNKFLPLLSPIIHHTRLFVRAMPKTDVCIYNCDSSLVFNIYSLGNRVTWFWRIWRIGPYRDHWNRAVRKTFLTFPGYKKYGWHFYLQMTCREFSKRVICCRKIATGTTLVDISRFRHLCDRVGDNGGISDYASSFLFTFTPHITLMCMYEYNVG